MGPVSLQLALILPGVEFRERGRLFKSMEVLACVNVYRSSTSTDPRKEFYVFGHMGSSPYF